MSHDPKLAPHAEAHPDAWHRHTHNEGAPQVEHGAKANPLLLSGVIAVMVVIFLATCVVIVMYFNKTMAESRHRLLETTELADGPDGSFARHENALKNAESYTWVDRETGIVTIPLSEAARSVVADYKENGSQGN
jgi:preprotein translocase subunit SecG